MATATVAIPQVTKAQATSALKHLQKAYGAQLTGRPGYNAYVVSMALAAGTQAQINALANKIGNMGIKGMVVAAPIVPTNPNLHFANKTAHQYHQLQKAPKVMGVGFATLKPACVQHGQKASQCTSACTYGLYVGGASKFVHNVLAVGKGSSTTTAPTTGQQPTTPTQPQGSAPTTPSN